MNRRRLATAAFPVVLAVVTAAVCSVGLPAPRDGGPVERLYEFKKHKNIPYYTGEDASRSKHRLDVYQPEGVKNAPVLIFIHGGAWRVGSKMFHTNVGKTFAARGIVTVSVNYRLSPKVKHPAHIRDVARAFDWVRKNIHNYGGNPLNVFVSGHSAGGHLVALLALNEKYLAEVGHTTDEIAGVIAISGVYRVGATGIFKGVFAAEPETLRDASPVLHVDDKQPPFLVIYAEKDMTGLDALAIGLAATLRQHKSPVRLLRVPDRSHSSIVWRIGDEDDPTTQAMFDFLSKNSRRAKK